MEDISSPQKRKLWGDLYAVHQDDFWLPDVYFQGINDTIKQFKPLPTDIILSCFPKTGTTWLKAILYSIARQPSKHRLATEHVHKLIPFLEQDVYGKPHECSATDPFPFDGESPRIFNTHIPYQLLRRALEPLQCRVVYVTRNPKDTLVSLWHFVSPPKLNEGDQQWSIETAFEEFCSGTITYGPYYEHVMGYKRLSLEKPENVLFLTYEELKSDSKSVVRALASFMGFPFEGEDAEERIEEIVKGCSFEVLSNHEVNKNKELLGSTTFSKSAFYRKGEVGDHKNVLTRDMIERIDALTREKFHSSGFMYGI